MPTNPLDRGTTGLSWRGHFRTFLLWTSPKFDRRKAINCVALVVPRAIRDESDHFCC